MRPLHRLFHVPRRAWWMLRQRGLPRLSYAASFLRSPGQIVGLWPESGIVPGPRVAIFVHYDPAGAVRADVLAHVAALRAAGLSVVFVTNSGRLQPEAMAALQPLCAGIIVRRNIGYDFGAMREGLDHLALPRPDTEMVLLVNDSVYGPLRPLDAVLRRIDFGEADVWGLTESWQTRYHLQSYFLAVGPKALSTRAWHAFWRRVRPVKSKWWVILQYEVGLTQHLLRAGLRMKAIWPYGELVDQVPALDWPKPGGESGAGDPALLDPLAGARLTHNRHLRAAIAARLALNPTADFWRELLRSGFPFIKRELLRFNPSGVGDIADWRAVVRQETGADLALIECDLQRVMRERAP